MSAHRRPTASSAAVSQFMSRLPRRDTKPEIALRRALHATGLRFRLQGMLPGKPDIVLTRARIAVFVDGCFWHGCEAHGVTPKTNTEFWKNKIAANRARDRRNDLLLAELGWLPYHVWEHQDPDEAAHDLERLWRERVNR